MKVLSFDCAYKSLGICCMEIKDDIKILYLNVINVSDSKNGIEQCTRDLKNVLESLDSELDNLTNVLIEYQMSANIKSNRISSQILYHYTNKADIKIIGPSLKNKVSFTDELHHSVFMKNNMSKYTANKKHTKENMLYWLRQRDLLGMISSIPKSNLDDAADAFMQVFGWLKTLDV